MGPTAYDRAVAKALQVKAAVVYSAAFLPYTPDSLEWQLEASIWSLRRHNSEIPVYLFLYGTASARLEQTCERSEVVIRRRGPYRNHLAAVGYLESSVLAEHPTLHRFLNTEDAELARYDFVLMVDADVVFLGDVGLAIGRYAHADFVAREEPCCKRSGLGYNPGYLDEDALVKLAMQEGITVPPPFNCGVVLLSQRAVAQVQTVLPIFLDYCWRLTTWMALNPGGVIATYGEGRGVELLRHLMPVLDHRSLKRPLAFPSPNRWILEQVGMWFALGHTTRLTFADFASDEIAQGGVVTWTDLPDSTLVWHYFSSSLPQTYPTIETLLLAGARIPGAEVPALGSVPDSVRHGGTAE